MRRREAAPFLGKGNWGKDSDCLPVLSQGCAEPSEWSHPPLLTQICVCDLCCIGVGGVCIHVLSVH